MAELPALQRRLAPFRGGASSELYNLNLEETFYDLNQLFNLVSEQAVTLADAQEVATIQTQFQQMQLNMLQTRLTEFQNQIEEMTANTKGYKSYLGLADFQIDPTADPTVNAQFDPTYNLLTLPYSGEVISKLYVYDPVLNQIFLPNSLSVTASPSSDGRTVIETDPNRAADGDLNTYWHRKYLLLQEDPTTQVTTEVVIDLPDDIISSRDVNMISINPFPLNSLLIEKVEYRLNGNWTLIPGFPTDSAGNPVPYPNAGNMKFYFASVPMGQVKITLTQTNPIIDGVNKVFHVGLQDVGIFYVGYRSNTGKFQIPIDLKGKTGSHMITRITPNFANEGALTDKSTDKNGVFTYAVYQYDSTGALTYTKDTLPIVINTDRIVIRASVLQDPYTQATPALESVTVAYQDA